MSHSKNLYTSVHTLPTDEAPDPETRVDSPEWEFFAADWPERVARLKEALASSPKKIWDRRVVGRGQMDPVSKRPEDGYQRKDLYRPCTMRFVDFIPYLINSPKIGLKDIGSFIVCGISLKQGSNDEKNFAGAQMLEIDLDGLLLDEEQFAFLRDMVMPAVLGGPFAWGWNKTASHLLPGKGDRRRLWIPLGMTISSYAEYADLCALVCERIQSYFPGQVGLDSTTSKKAMQCLYDPRYSDEERAKVFGAGREGGEDCWLPEAEMVVIREKRAREKAVAAARKEEEKKAQEIARSTGRDFDFDLSCHDGDPESRARARLAKLTITVGAGERNKKIRRALWICRDSGLDQHASENLVIDTYGDEVNERGWVTRWARTLWKTSHTQSRSFRRRRTVVQRTDHLTDWCDEGGIVVFDLAGKRAGAETEETPRITEHVFHGATNSDNCPSQIRGPTPSSPEHTSGAARSEVADVAPPDIHAPWVGRGLATPRSVIVCNDKYITIPDDDTFMTVIDSGCGTGKTVAMKAQFEQTKAKGKRCLRIVPSLALAEGQGAELGVHSHQTSPDWHQDSVVTTLHSVWKWWNHKPIESSETVELSLNGEDAPSQNKDTTPALAQLDEANELLEALTSKPMRDNRKCDAVQRRLKAILRGIEAAGGKVTIAQANVSDDTLKWIHRLCGWKPGEQHSWRLITNKHQTLKPKIYRGTKVEHARWVIMEAWRKGRGLLVQCGTKGIADEESRLFAVRTMSERAGFDVGAFCGEAGMASMDPEIPALEEELAKRGLTLAGIRPRILCAHSERVSQEYLDLMADPSKVWEWDAIFVTPLASSGVSFERPMTTVAIYREGAGPGAETLFQSIFRCRQPIDNVVYVFTFGQIKRLPIDTMWWLIRISRLGSEFKQLTEGICEITPGKRNGEDWATETNEELMTMLAESYGRHESLLHITDTYDDFGNLLEAGDFTNLCIERGFDVQHIQAIGIALDMRDEDQVKADKKLHTQRREAIRKFEDRDLLAEEPIKYEDAKALQRKGARGMKARRQIRAAKIRHKYGLESLNQDVLDYERKHGTHIWTMGVYRAYSEPALPEQKSVVPREVTIKHYAESCGPIEIYVEKEILRAQYLQKWMPLMAPMGLADAVAKQTPVCAIGPWLAQKVNEHDRTMVQQLFGFSVEPEDLQGTEMTTLLLRAMGLKLTRKKTRKGKGTRSWEHRVTPESYAMALKRSQFIMDRILKPDEAQAAWDVIEAQTFAVAPDSVEVKPEPSDILAAISAPEEWPLAD